MDSLYLFANSTDNKTALTLIMLAIVWSLIWKGIALWKAARLSQKNWFIILLVVNTLGVLEIIYIFAVARERERASGPSTQMNQN